ncbi:LysR family transcriptional regulator [Bradyrhizobium manausense]|uniref:LysR substrate-binding domain-containing protein n=1 Tax=Bradyrhizobium manausense TaxID=989370 RepID=UPI001BA54022|nr:LysR substrate-binding domain-containing protein [Bradyrhizobium manausense]MBR0687167.1 LysR family transcriptional regulator [Bradyrhizobium manausense]
MSFQNLPPLNALRYFEAAARKGSFTSAAEELHLTQSAVSQQIRNLETFIGAALFRRSTTTIELTDVGKAYFGVVSKALERIDIATALAKAAPGTKRIEQICLSASPSFVHLWLVKRLSKFHREVRSVQLSLNVTRHYVDFEAENVDMAIRHGNGEWPGLQAELLMKDRIVAVCSPRILQGRRQPRGLAEIGNHPIIEDRVHRYWTRYARFVGGDIDVRNAILYDDSGVIVEAAINEQGIAMARASLAASAISRGHLVELFEAKFSETLGYYVVFPAAHALRKNVARVSKWLKLEAARERG